MGSPTHLARRSLPNQLFVPEISKAGTEVNRINDLKENVHNHVKFY
jgi:hypothetical protein